MCLCGGGVLWCLTSLEGSVSVWWVLCCLPSLAKLSERDPAGSPGGVPELPSPRPARAAQPGSGTPSQQGRLGKVQRRSQAQSWLPGAPGGLGDPRPGKPRGFGARAPSSRAVALGPIFCPGGPGSWGRPAEPCESASCYF